MKFSLGRTVMTAGVSNAYHPLALLESLNRHAAGDWGVVCEEDKKVNEESLRTDGRLLSAYDVPDQTGEVRRIWIITEWDRSVTTVLFPEEY